MLDGLATGAWVSTSGVLNIGDVGRDDGSFDPSLRHKIVILAKKLCLKRATL